MVYYFKDFWEECADNMSNVAVLIPCYNEENTIFDVVRNFRKFLPNADIYVYDNNSTDRTAVFAELAGAIVRKSPKQGKGNVIQQMFKDIDKDCYLIVDGDDTYPAESAKEMVDIILDRQADMVVGDRLSSTYYKENKSLARAIGNHLVCNLTNKLFDGNVTDVMSGYRALNRNYVNTINLHSEGFEIETEMTIMALASNMKIKSIPIQYRDRPEGSKSKLHTYSDGYKVVKLILKMKKEIINV